MSVTDATSMNGANPTPASAYAEGFTESLEFRKITEIAWTYLNAGLIEEAEDLLLEVDESDLERPEMFEIRSRLAELKGDQPQAPSSNGHRKSSKTLLHLTRPLPGADRLPRTAQRYIADSEHDYIEGRYHAALDSCMMALASVPGFLPNYLRMAEIRIALGDADGALELVQTVERLYQFDGVEADPLIRGVRLALNPDDSETLIEHARYLLDQRGAVALEPFLPAAIEASAATDPDTARELSRAYVQLRPSDQEAVRVYLRAAVTTGGASEIIEALNRHVTADSASPDLLYLRAAAASEEGDEAWTRWLERAVKQLRQRPDQYAQVQTAIEDSARIVPDGRRHLAAAVAALAAAQWEISRAEIDAWRFASDASRVSPVDRFIAAYTQASAAASLGLPDVVAMLAEAVEAGLAAEVQPFLEGTELFDERLTLADLLGQYTIEVVGAGLIGDGISTLQGLKERYPDQLVLRSHLADLLIQARRINDGIRELRAIAQAYERAGNLTAMIDAMRRISQAVPDNIEIKSMLIDVYTRRGILDEALEELEALASLYLDRDNPARAVQTFTRAAEIAFAVGDLDRGNTLYQRGVEVDPNDVPVRHAAVAFYLQTGMVDRAADQLREVVRIALEDEDPDEAIAALHQIIGLAPDDASAYHRLGEILTSIGEYNQAERVYRRLAQFAPNDPVLQAKQSALAVLAASG